LLHEIKSLDCEHVSSREEDFFSVQCEVKNKSGLVESLASYVEGETLDGG
jgi:ubiquitin carboxyl-terminal hydrolase 34